jgi:gluconate 2-dehydrogenase gamma chain
MRFLTDEESRDVAAIAERIFPAGPDGPGASELDVLTYIDGQLGGQWGSGAGMYREEPFLRPTHPGHGWQSPLTPREAYHHGLESLAEHTLTTHGCRFADLPIELQDSVLSDLEQGRLGGLGELDEADFFRLVRQNVLEGLFSDPSHGGNRNMEGWRWLGYPGVASSHGDDYREHVARYGEPYRADPLGLP